MYRFQFEISEEQYRRSLKCFEQYGLRKAVFSPILDEVMDMIEQHGHLVVAILLDKTTKIREIVPSLAKAERMAEK